MLRETELTRSRGDLPSQESYQQVQTTADVDHLATTPTSLYNSPSRAVVQQQQIFQQQVGESNPSLAPVSTTVPAYIKIANRQSHFADSDDEEDYEEYEQTIHQLPHHQYIPKKKDENHKDTCLEKLDKRFSQMVNIESSVADSEDFPLQW
jgi:hypothetical protein